MMKIIAFYIASLGHELIRFLRRYKKKHKKACLTEIVDELFGKMTFYNTLYVKYLNINLSKYISIKEQRPSHGRFGRQ